MVRRWALVFLIALGFSGALVLDVVAEDVKSPVSQKWRFLGIFGSFDRSSVQRGYQVYKEVCASCHSMNRIAFRNLLEVGFSQDEVKAIASSYMIKDGPNDEGEMFERPGVPSDYFPSPFPNREAAIFANGGAYPPDLSLIIKARQNGANYVYSLLRGYDATRDGGAAGGLYSNPYFPGGEIAMPPPLVEGVLSYADGSDATIDNMAWDVVNFLQWASEPEMEIRKKLGMKVVICLVIITLLLVFVNRRLWATLRR